MRRFFRNTLIAGASVLVAPSARGNPRRIPDDVDVFSDDEEPGEPHERLANPQHIVLTRTIDIDCPACGAAAGDRCDGGFCRPRMNLAAARTREANRRARGR